MNTDYTTVWKECLAELEKNPTVSAVALDVFIRTLEPIMIHDGNLVLMSATENNKNIINKNYIAKINDALHVGYPAYNAVVMDKSEQHKIAEPIESPVAENPMQYATTKLRADYTFENFVVGKNNQFVHAAAKAISENPGSAYNPLFIYGNVGLGKTHVMQAIGNAVLKEHPSYRVVYVTCANFVNDFISSIRMAKEKNSAEYFRARYRNCDLLLIDDIQFIKDKTGTQEELFHIFNDLRDAGKQLIFTSDRPPRDINPLTERLRSRMASGLIADIQPPDFETRVAILQKKATMHGYSVCQDVLNYIADQNDDNVRTLEENLTRAYFYASINDRELTVEVAKEALRDTAGEEEQLDVDTIIDVVCKYYSVSREDLIGKKKTKDIAYYRQMCIYIITETMPIPLTSIGKIFGGRDHTTIMHSRDKIAAALDQNSAVKTALQDIRNMIYKK